MKPLALGLDPQRENFGLAIPTTPDRPNAKPGSVHPECARFLSYLSLLHIRRVHGKILGRTVIEQVHPGGAQNKTLISDTASPNASRWNIGRIRSPGIGACVGHVDCMWFVSLSLALGSQRERNFRWNMGLTPYLQV